MEDGCVFSIDYECKKFELRCRGDCDEKLSCPAWGEVVAAEEYYSKKLDLDRHWGN